MTAITYNRASHFTPPTRHTATLYVAAPEIPLDDSADRTTQLNGVMAQVAHGDEHAFDALYELVSGVVFGTALRVLRSQALAEEAAQEALVAVWKNARRWDPAKGSAMTFILTITRRKAIDRVRSEEARKAREERVSVEAFAPDMDASSDEAIEREESSALRSRLAELSEKQREVVVLAFFAGRTHAEIAEQLEIPLGTVKSRMREAFLNLRHLTEANS